MATPIGFMKILRIAHVDYNEVVVNSTDKNKQPWSIGYNNSARETSGQSSHTYIDTSGKSHPMSSIPCVVVFLCKFIHVFSKSFLFLDTRFWPHEACICWRPLCPRMHNFFCNIISNNKTLFCCHLLGFAPFGKNVLLFFFHCSTC